MSGHTPTEWLADGAVVYALNLEGTNRFYCHVQSGWTTQGRTRTTDEELAANARLIASAPELLGALIAMVDAHDIWLNDGRPFPITAKDSARSAIAKATGGTP